jgi:hypothetical protein
VVVEDKNPREEKGEGDDGGDWETDRAAAAEETVAGLGHGGEREREIQST